MRKRLEGLKGLAVGLGAALAAAAVGLADASACSRHGGHHGYNAPPVAYRYAPPPVYGYGPPPAVYARPFAPGYGGASLEAPYGYRADEDCACDDDGYAHAPPVAYDDGYRPAGVWVPAR